MTNLDIEGKYAGVGYESPLEGVTSKSALRELSLAEVLSLELLPKLSARQKVEMLKAVFVLLARSQNDKAACDAIQAVYFFTVPAERTSPFAAKTSPEEHSAKVRKEKLQFLTWLESVYWSLPLYKGDYWEERTNGFVGFTLRDPLPLLKNKVIKIAASSLWNGLHDETGLRAFNFLLASANTEFFRKKAPEVTRAIRDYKEKHRLDTYGFDRFELPRDDIKMVLQAIRQSVPTKVRALQVWIAQKDTLPDEVWKIFAHAYVNAGGEILVR